MKNDHIVLYPDRQVIACTICGQEEPFTLPQRMGTLVEQGETFAKRHKHGPQHEDQKGEG